MKAEALGRNSIELQALFQAEKITWQIFIHANKEGRNGKNNITVEHVR